MNENLIWKMEKQKEKSQINETFIRIFCERAHIYESIHFKVYLYKQQQQNTARNIISIKFKFSFFLFYNLSKWYKMGSSFHMEKT